VVLVLVGFTRFAGAGDDLSGGAPDALVVFAAGGLLTAIGPGLLRAGFVGVPAGHDAGETMPVVEGIAPCLTDGRGVLRMSRRVEETAQFCDSRGRRLV
jgi:hypothetical protein